jgi:hypothetical protein
VKDMQTLTLKVEGAMKFQRGLNVKLDLEFLYHGRHAHTISKRAKFSRI